MRCLKLVIALILIMGIIYTSVADINHGHGLDEHVEIRKESRV